VIELDRVRGGTEFTRIGEAHLPRGGDIIVGLDGRPVPNVGRLILYLGSEKWPGDTVDVTFDRKGRERLVEATLDERPQ
jgi:serine protease Do